MSAACAVAGKEPSVVDPVSAPVPVPTAVEFHYTQTDSFVALLHQLYCEQPASTLTRSASKARNYLPCLRCGLVYKTHKCLVHGRSQYKRFLAGEHLPGQSAAGGLVAREAQGGLSTLVRTFEKPMGLAVDARRLALGTRDQIWLLRNAPDIAPRIEPPGQHDGCYLPRSCHVTGDIAGHEIAWAGEELWIVNTRFSCLCALHPDYSFVPRWQPPFITALAAEDRCHLNGLALAEGERGVLYRTRPEMRHSAPTPPACGLSIKSRKRFGSL